MELYRPLKKGNQYKDIIPKADCKKKNMGNGNTDFSIQKMAEVIFEYSWQMKKVAKLLKTNILKDTVANIHHFCYWHFQYLADDDEQMLRSPACSWHQREVGIDCKSYTIIASSLLSEMGIPHLIRKVNYTTEPEAYSHVYVVVPIFNNNIDKGYYIIDGTLETNEELKFIEKKDKVMKHTILNKPNNEQGLSLPSITDDLSHSDIYEDNGDLKFIPDTFDHLGNNGLNGGFDISNISANSPEGQFIQKQISGLGSSLWGQTSLGSDPQINAVIQGGIKFATTGNPLDAIEAVRVMLPKVGLKDILEPQKVLNEIKNWMQRLKCIGGSMMNEGDLARTQQVVGSFFLNLLNKINAAANEGDLDLLSKLVTDYQGLARAAKGAYYFKTGDGYNFCSRESLYGMELYCLAYETIGKFLGDWLDKYYTKTEIGKISYNRDSILATNQFPYGDSKANWGFELPKYKLMPKEKVVKAFEITDRVKDAMPTSLSTLDGLVEFEKTPDIEFVEDLVRPVSANIPVIEIEKAIGTPVPTPTPTPTPVTATNTNKAGFPWVIGLLMIGVAWGISRSAKTKKVNV